MRHLWQNLKDVFHLGTKSELSNQSKKMVVFKANSQTVPWQVKIKTSTQRWNSTKQTGKRHVIRITHNYIHVQTSAFTFIK